jgi:hypothetical protein
MDPLAALSLAGNVIQFVDFGSRILGIADELYHSASGALAVNDELEFVTNDLRTLVTKLRNSLHASDIQTDPDGKFEIPWGGFKSLCDKSACVAEELVTKLENLKVKDDDEYTQGQNKYRKFRSLKMALKNLGSKTEISALAERLSKLREGLETRVLLSIRLAGLNF